MKTSEDFKILIFVHGYYVVSNGTPWMEFKLLNLLNHKVISYEAYIVEGSTDLITYMGAIRAFYIASSQYKNKAAIVLDNDTVIDWINKKMCGFENINNLDTYVQKILKSCDKYLNDFHLCETIRYSKNFLSELEE